MHNPTRASALLTFVIAAASSICFCTKGVFAKLAYAEGADSITVLALRMGMALPVFLAVGWWTGRGTAQPVNSRDWLRLLLLGFLGYYVSSFVKFLGLQYVSVGLERMVLYTYPSLVLVGSAVFLKRRIRPGMWPCMAVAYAGIACAFSGESMQTTGSLKALATGTGLVFLSALTYAWFILSSGELLHRMGPAVFTSRVVAISCVMILAHYAATRPVTTLFQLSGKTYACGATLALLGTVVPSYLLGIGLKLAGAQKFAVIGTVGPIVSILLAAAVLGETLHFWQVAGFLLSLAGGLGITLLKEKPACQTRPEVPSSAPPRTAGASSLLAEPVPTGIKTE